MKYCLLLCAFLVGQNTFADIAKAESFGFEPSTESATAFTYEHFDSAQSDNKGQVLSSGGRTGNGSLYIESKYGDDARFVKFMKVEPEQFYEVHVWYKAELTNENDAVNVSVLGLNLIPQFFGDTQGQWKEIVVYGQTAREQTEVKLALRLGFYGRLAQGKVWFDDLSFIKMADGKLGAPSWADSEKSASAPIATPKIPQRNLIILTMWIVLSLLLMYFVIRWSKYKTRLIDASESPTLLVAVVLVGLGLLRLFVAFMVDGYKGDQNTFVAWGLNIYQHGPTQFYASGQFADYPPLYMYVVWGLAGISQFLGLAPDSQATYFLFKLPSVFADLGLIFVVYLLIAKKSRNGLIALMFLALSPLLFIDGPVWGQIDSLAALVFVFTLYFIEKGKLYLAGLWFGLALLLKPQAIFLAPIAIIALIKEWRGPKTLFVPLISLITFFGLSLPFWITTGPQVLLNLYVNTINSYAYETLNAMNVFMLAGGNGVDQMVPFLGIPAYLWGYLLAGASIVLVAIWLFRAKDESKYFIGAGLVVTAFFVFMPRMHERYLFVAPILLLCGWLLKPRSLYLKSSLIGFLLAFLNIFLVFEYHKRTGESYLPYDAIVAALSLAHLVWFVATLVLVLAKKGDTPVLAEPLEKPKPTEPFLTSFSQKHRLPFVLATLGLTVLIGAISFANLGSTKSPQAFWLPSPTADYAVFEFEKPQPIDQIYYHQGLGVGNYLIETRNSIGEWSTLTEIKNENLYSQFQWRAIESKVKVFAIRIKLLSGNLQLNELAFVYDKKLLPKPRLVDANVTLNKAHTNPAFLFDEQTTFDPHAGWFEGMYFDEVYHARSAWEMINHIDATENTHPPFGKIMISWGIQLFGMNPFGWRFMGTLVGVLMVPLIFLIGRRLFRSDLFGFISALVFSLDLMRLSQTRIATIDSFVLFWILASYAAMLWFFQSKKNFIPLIVSGICIGLAIASKWIGIYAAIGLLILFFINLYRPSVLTDSSLSALKTWRLRTFFVALATCVLLPLLIYTLSYIPHMQDTGLGLKAMVDNQASMWNYHSTLEASHPYTSPWYSWPLMLKPMWYFGGSYSLHESNITIISFGNLVVWVLGLVCLLAIIGWRIVLWQRNLNKPISASDNESRSIMTFIIIGFLAQYLPWAIIPRSILFIYHYFATIPFLVFAFVFMLKRLYDQENKTAFYVVGISSLFFMFVFFFVFYPIATGTPVDMGFGQVLKSIFSWVTF